MSEIRRTRTLRPSTRQASSSYKVNTTKVGSGDILVVEIKDEKEPEEVLFRFRFAGRDLAHKNSIHFDAVETAEGWQIKWRGATPL